MIFSAEPAHRWKELYRYWRGKHVGSRPPSRRDIDPLTEIPTLVSSLALIEAESDGFRYRLVGATIVDQANMEMTARRVGESSFKPHIAATWADALRGVVADRQPRLVTGEFAFPTEAFFKGLMLPLLEKSDDHTTILLGSFTQGFYEPGVQVDKLTVSIVTGISES
jgi:hypothetical protein